MPGHILKARPCDPGATSKVPLFVSLSLTSDFGAHSSGLALAHQHCLEVSSLVYQDLFWAWLIAGPLVALWSINTSELVWEVWWGTGVGR